ncbi:WD repeat-containing protein 6-like [Daphnia pulicaria]|uniref:WD repeat-containing protein 6-like n=1 Tax=Daphnia pulicaria TaxID=35523 RepID=UPI001EE9EAE3|nr:WD repeat-containing protein 6-like [Daphnia pulicaria]XP_046645597.1 WD repeat-containing protein 6-like [Daphnia pulicaria]XP_046645598.1 WD repeat-containing protein 6-like [Daphnia pulicaria]XP_046645599.1 WD repeat-containing protein 6-like [Daphnia pulicaria]XP_046645600.1 WD repeat-containing protein 6-like [Daphnia pulicaria]XP_046645601.1 WD repeat-containing protein 6-like [Daphnia pulicaria]
MVLKKLYLQTHVTALCTVEPHFLLEGCGGFINLYDFDSNELLESLDIFRGARIHGIRYSHQNKTVIVFGGKLFALVSFNDSETALPRLKLLQKSNEADWIRDAKFVNNGDYLVKLTSHNKVIIEKTSSEAETVEVQGDEQCILYCGKILGEDLSQLTILAGTVFGNILVWAASPSQQDKCLFHRLTGHNGVIFSINYDEVSRTIISTSDDRSVRFWSLQCEDEVPNKLSLWSLFQRSKIHPKHELYGHEARVWNSVIIRQNQCDSGLVASLGEDSRICLWDLTSGKLVSKFDAHPGTSVWAAVWDSRLQLLVTAGGEGSTRIWNANHLQETSCRQLQLTEDGQVPRLVIVTSTGYYRHLVASQLGIIYGWDSHAQIWVSLFQDEGLGNGSVLDSDGRTIIFGTRTGAVFVFASGPSSLELLATHQLEKTKIYSLHLVASQQQEFMACLDNGRLLLMNVLGGSESPPRAQFILPDGKQRWPSCVLATQNRFMMGDREGSFHLYSTEKETPLQSFSHIHGKNGLTDIQSDPNGQHLYYTGGRDGRIGLWRLTDDQNQLELLSLTNTSLGWIAGLRWIDKQLTYLAFQSDRFVVWSSEQQRSLMQVPCGGGHRSWDFDVTSSDVTFLFIKDRHIYENRRPLSAVFNSSLPGRCGGHSKSICRGRFVGFHDDSPLVLTGSEDTTMRLSLFDRRSAQSLTVITKHVSSVRALAVKELACRSAGTWLCVSAGGRAQLSVGLLTLSGQGDQVHVIHRDVRSHFLRGWLRRAATNKPWIHGSDQLSLIPDPETRYMDVDVVDRGDSNFHIIAACSDSFIRIFDLSLEGGRLDLFHELNFHNCCVLLVKVVADPDGNTILFSAGTDGRLAVWDVTVVEEDKAMDPLGSLSIHQSGINSLDCQWIDLNRMLVLTGGDDNALICTKVEISCERNLLRLIDQQKLFPHAAQISGVALLGHNLCLSVSLDQRLILWKREDTRLMWQSAVCCDVSDIQGLHVSAGATKTLSKVLVYGQGIQVFEVDDDSLNIAHTI